MLTTGRCFDDLDHVGARERRRGTPSPCAPSRRRRRSRMYAERAREQEDREDPAPRRCRTGSGCASIVTCFQPGSSERELDAEAAELDERHRGDILARAPRGPVGALVGLVAQLAADDLGPVDDADAVVVGLDVVGGRATVRRIESTASSSTIRPTSPVSSRSSRSAPASGCSPKSMPPPGQRPPARPLGDVAEPAQQQPRRVVDAHVVRRDALDPRQQRRSRAHVPSNFASRFSRNAAMPSTRSGDAVASAWK